jgi:hypothetical protein
MQANNPNSSTFQLVWPWIFAIFSMEYHSFNQQFIFSSKIFCLDQQTTYIECLLSIAQSTCLLSHRTVFCF